MAGGLITASIIGAGLGGLQSAGGMGMFSSTDPGKKGRDANQARVKAGKAQNDLIRKRLAHEEEVAIETLRIQKENYLSQAALTDEERARDWWRGEQIRRDKYDKEVAAYDQSVEDYTQALNFNDISANMAYQMEENDMTRFYTEMKLKKARARIELKQSIVNQQTEQLALRAQMEGVKEAAAHADQDLIKEGIKSEGKLKATGMAGRSARKAIQAVQAGVGSEQAERADAVMNRDSIYRNEMQRSYNNLYFKKVGYQQGINENKRKIWMQLNENKLREAKIAAGKYSADLQAKAQVHSVPTPDRMEAVPFKTFIPEFQKIEKGSWKKYAPTDPQLSDANKIYGDQGPSTMDKVLGVGMGMVQGGIKGYIGAGGGFGGGFDTGDAGLSIADGTGPGISGDEAIQIGGLL